MTFGGQEMNMKTLLGTAAGLMVATGAYAADLPGDAAPAAVDYVKVCDAFGAGFFYIPGTDTCLDISGRVRGGISFKDTATTDFQLSFTNAARVQFDARSATDLGTLRTFAEFSMEDADRGVKVNNAFIQLGYVTVGRQDDVADGDVLYGDNGFTDIYGGAGDNSYNGITVVVDNLGGGFYVGAGIYGDGGVKEATIINPTTTSDANVGFEGIIGVAKQSWGSADISGGYWLNDAHAKDDYFVKATAEFLLGSGLSTRLTGGYVSVNGTDWEVVSGAIKYQATAALDVYTGGAYRIQDGSDGYALQIGADYTVVPGLTLTAEVNYGERLDYATGSDWNGILRLSRSW